MFARDYCSMRLRISWWFSRFSCAPWKRSWGLPWYRYTPADRRFKEPCPRVPEACIALSIRTAAVFTVPAPSPPDYATSRRAPSRCRKWRRSRASSGVGCVDGVGSKLLNSTSRARTPRACASGTGNCCRLVAQPMTSSFVRALRFSINGLSYFRVLSRLRFARPRRMEMNAISVVGNWIWTEIEWTSEKGSKNVNGAAFSYEIKLSALLDIITSVITLYDIFIPR